MPSVKFTAATLRDLARLRAFLQHKNPIASQKAAATTIQSVQIIIQHPQIAIRLKI
jgi:plasmid stabilization system protein ParE